MSFKYDNITEHCSFLRGLTYKKTDEVAYSKNAILRSNNVSLITNKLVFDEIKYIDDKILINDSKKVKKGSLLICTANGSKSHLGKVALIENEIDFAFGGFMGLIVPNKNLIGKFLYYNLIAPRYKKFIESLSDGANINNLKFSQFNDFTIPVPSIMEQQAIVEKLDFAFDAIEKAKANIEKNIENAKELFQSKLNAIFSQKGEGWVENELYKVCEELFAGGDVPKNQNSKVRTNEFAIPIFTNGEKNKGLYGFTNIVRVLKPAVTISARGTIGYTQIRNEPFYPAVRLIVAIPKENIIKIDFLHYFFNCMNFINTGSSIPQLTVPMVKNLIIYYPATLKEQEIIVAKLNFLSQQTELLQEKYKTKLANLEELKKSILEKAFKRELV